MAIGSDNKFPKVFLTTQASNPSTPTSGDWKLFAKADGIFAMGSNATAVGPFGTGSSTPTFVGARATNTAGTSIANNTETSIPFATEDYDTDSFHDNASNNTRLTCPSGKNGYYLIIGNVLCPTATSGDQYVYIRKNGTGYLGFVRGREDAGFAAQVSVVVYLAATDYVELRYIQVSGSARALDTTAGINFLSAARIGT